MAISIEDLFLYLTASSDIVIVLIFLFSYRKFASQRNLYLVIGYCFLSPILNYVAEQFLHQNHKYIFYIFFTLIEYTLFAWFISTIINNQKAKNAITILSLGFLVFMSCYLLLFKHEKIDSVAIGIESILIMIYSFYYLYEQMNDTTNLFIYSKFEFWIIAGILLYLAGSFFIYIFASQVDSKFLHKYWFLTNTFYIIKNIFFGIGILTFLKQSKHIPPSKPTLATYLN